MIKKVVKLKDGDVIKYKDLHSKCGKMEFVICPIFKYGKLKKMLIYPQQPIDDVDHYEIECYNQQDFSIMSWTHKGFENPWIWMHFFCKEHKCLALRTYVPIGTDTLKISNMSTLTLIFEKTEEPNDEN